MMHDIQVDQVIAVIRLSHNDRDRPYGWWGRYTISKIASDALKRRRRDN